MPDPYVNGSEDYADYLNASTEKPRIRVAAPSVRITWTQYALNYMNQAKGSKK